MNMIIRANIGRQLDIFHDNSDIIYMRKKTFLTYQRSADRHEGHWQLYQTVF